MAVLWESPWYQKFIQTGRAEGRVEGRAEGQVTMLLKILSRQVGIDAENWRGASGKTLHESLNACSEEQLDALAEAVFNFPGGADLVAWLQQQES
jgi:hypothetical protein